MAVRQYIGARYVPKFFYGDGGSTDWVSGVQYEPLTIVTRLGNSYTSRKPVPVNIGAPEENPEYWVSTGNYNSQVEQYINVVESYKEQVDDYMTTYDFIYVVDEDTTITGLNSAINELSGNVWLYMKADVTLAGNATLSNKVMRITGLGGIFVNSTANRITLTVKSGITIESDVQLFSGNITVSASNGIIRGTARPQMWGAIADLAHNVQNECDSCTWSDFQDIEFIGGTYRAYVSNNKSNRHFNFYENAIIDGVVHIATGDSGSAMVQNITVDGVITSTLRVGTYHCNNVKIAGIKILDANELYPNQTTEGGPKGVHIYRNSHYVDIGFIHIENALSSYGFGIDKDQGENNSTYITVDRIIIDKIAAGLASVLLTYCGHVFINQITDNEADHNHVTLQIGAASYINVGMVSASGNYPSIGKILITDSARWVNFGIVVLYSSSVVANGWGFVVNNCNDIHVDYISIQNFVQGIRNVGSLRLGIDFAQFANVTTKVANSEGTYYICKDWSAD